MSDRPGVWRLLRGGLAFVAIPALLVVLAAMLFYLYRCRALRSLAVLGAVALLGNVTAQSVKHVPLGLGQAWSTLNPLSGHVAVAASIGLGWLIVIPGAQRSVSAMVSSRRSPASLQASSSPGGTLRSRSSAPSSSPQAGPWRWRLSPTRSSIPAPAAYR